MDVPENHILAADPKSFLKGVYLHFHRKFTEEILALKGVSFQLALKIHLQKDNPDDTEEYTDSMLCHKQEAVLQPSETKKALDKAFLTIQEKLETWIQQGPGWELDRIHILCLDIT